MLKRGMMFGAVLLLVLSSFTLTLIPAAAQSDDWSVYLIESMTQQVLRIYRDGRQQSYDLGLPAGTYIGRESVDFTPDGNRVAYCSSTNQADGAYVSLVVKDIANPTPLFTVDLGKSDGCWLEYSNDGSQIAAGIVRHYAGDPAVDASQPTWQLLIFDAATGAQLHEMNPIKGAATFDIGRTIMPEVRYFAGDLLVFAGVAWGTEGIPSSPAYLWQTTSDAIQPVDRWWRSGWDTLAYTGELTWTEVNPNLPAAEPGGPMPQANVVKIANDNGQESTIYSNTDWVIMGTKFIDSGRQLAINELLGFDPNNMQGSQSTRWIALNRDGTTSELLTTPGFTDLVAAPDGYVILAASDNSATPLLTLDYYSGREKTTLWQQQASNGITWSILWASPTRPAEGLQPFPAISTP